MQAFPGTWSLAWTKGKPYAQAKRGEKTIYLHRWIAEAADDEQVQFRGSTLDCRRQNLEVTARHRSYARQIARRRTPTERLQYTKALAQRLAERSGQTPPRILRALLRDALDAALEETASRAAGERVASLPPLRLRSGWEHRLPEILQMIEATPEELVGRRTV